jgi:uncharacterized protein (TIGR01244 family)
MTQRTALLILVAATAASGAARMQEITKPVVPGVRNFARLESTIACAGATTAEGIGELKKLGYAAVINLREATESGADVDAAAAAAKDAGVRYIHLPLNAAKPDTAVVDRFLEAIVEPANQPVVVHCGSGNRAAALWMIKRMVVDGWEAGRASAEAAALGLSSAALKAFAIEYAAARKR